VKLEFLTATADKTGTVVSVVTDSRQTLSVADDRTSTHFNSGETKRIISNYEVLSDNTVRIYAMSAVLSPAPVPLSDKAFNGVLKSDPMEMTSIWAGYKYINMLLSLKADGTAAHLLHFIEESAGEVDADGERSVNILLYHDSNDSGDYYTKRAYVSLPLEQYITDGCKRIRVTVAYYNTDNVRTEQTVVYTVDE
jgi:hypothetical protein